MMIDVAEKLENSFSKIEEVCPKTNVLGGMVVRDLYHERQYSLLTLCQVLWAVTLSGIYPKTFYLTADLLKQINYEIQTNKYFEKHDRIIGDAFIFLAFIYTGQPTDSDTYISVLNEIIKKQSPEGWWSTYTDGEPDVRATSLCLLALSECYFQVCPSDKEPYSNVCGSINLAIKWLVKQYKDKQYCERKLPTMNSNSIEKTYGIELTAVASYSLLKSINVLDKEGLKTSEVQNVVYNSAKWFMGIKPNDIKNLVEVEQEKYTEEDKILTHDYSSGDLEMVILFLSEFIHSNCYIYVKGIHSYLEKLVSLLIENEKNGEWFDKHSQSYNRIWRISYAIVALTSYQNYTSEKKHYKEYRQKRTKDILGGIKSFIFKYILNPVLDVIYILIAAIVFYLHEFLMIRVEFINSTAVSIIGLLLGIIGLIFPHIEKWYNERKER